MADKTLSILIPAYNEEAFIGPLLDKIDAVDVSVYAARKEIIVVDDCSRDRTSEIVREKGGDVLLDRLERNQGKGAAVRRALELATGDLILIQDADLEYEPEDYPAMLEALARSDVDAVYGSRYMSRTGGSALFSGKHENQGVAAYLGGRALSLVGWAFTGTFLTDTVTAYKLFEAPVIKPLALETSGFELDHEITSRLLAAGRKIVEVPIRYYPRSVEEGKKIGLRDFFIAIKTFFRFRNG